MGKPIIVARKMDVAERMMLASLAIDGGWHRGPPMPPLRPSEPGHRAWIQVITGEVKRYADHATRWVWR